MATEKPLDWIKQVDLALFELEEKPQFGNPALFDWGLLEKRLQELFKTSLLKIKHHEKGWLNEGELVSEIGENPLLLTFEWAPLAAPAYFVTTDHDLKRLMAELLAGEKEAAYFYDPSLIQGFYHYFAAEMLHVLEELGFASPLSPRLKGVEGVIQEGVGSEACFVVDVSCAIGKQNFWGKVLVPDSFRRDWKSYFSNLPPPSLSDELREKISVDVSLEVGHTQLSFQDWKEVRAGDFILLDHCSYDPAEGKGGVVLALNQTPLFRGRFKDKGIKLTEYPSYEEVGHAMDENPFEEESEQEEDLYGDPLPTEEGEEEGVATTLAPSEPILSAEQLPIQLTVEVGRLRMTAKELMDLAPGNLLEINAAPEQGVDLVVNGKKVGRGELIRLGETLGVRILSL
ncbi:MAG: hypothetical protein S4CHLAM2_04340 [Chlamydiales bacterium]|nr:hypothetical protein [Chlamydiales bacterium]